MNAPEKIWANVTVTGDFKPLAGEWNYKNVGNSDDTEYRRADMIPNAAYVAGLEAAAKRALEEAVADDMDTWFEGLRAALSARSDAPSCRVCGKGGLSTIEDGGPECQLHDETWVCSSECYIIACPDAPDTRMVPVAQLERDKAELQKQLNQLLTIIDDWDSSRAVETGGFTMHVYGQTPDWFVDAAHWACYGYGYDDQRAIIGEPKE